MKNKENLQLTSERQRGGTKIVLCPSRFHFICFDIITTFLEASVA